MKGKMKKLVLLIILFSIQLTAQQISNWQNYTDLQIVNDIIYKNQTIWAATNGGVFNYLETNNSYQVLTKSEGLSSHSTTSIAIDDNNKIWIGTSEGYLDVYDLTTGSVHTIYDLIKENENNKRINDIQISNDTAFVSTEFGLVLFNTNDNSVFDGILKFGNFTTRTPVKTILLGSKIYVLTQSGIAISKTNTNNLSAPESWETIDISNTPSFTTINDIVLFNNILHVATNRGVYSYNSDKWELISLRNKNVINLAIKEDFLLGFVWHYNSQIKKFDKSYIYKISNNNEELLYTKSFLISDIIVSDNAKEFYASNIGIIQLLSNELPIYLPNSPKTNSIQSMSVDNEGNLWVATGKDGHGIGVLKFNGDLWETINKDSNQAFATNDFHRVYASNNAVYFSSWGFGFARYKDDEYTAYNTTNTNLLGTKKTNHWLVINGIWEDNLGNAWIANYEAADRKSIIVLTKDDQIYNYEFASPLSPTHVNLQELVVDQYNTKWFSGDLNGDISTEGLYYFNENNTFEDYSDDIWGKITKSNGLRDEDVRALAIDQFGELIIGTSVGVDIIQNTSSPSVRGDQYFALRQQTINAIVVDPINQKWFGTERGIFLMSSDGSTLLANYTKDNSPLPSDNILSMAIDKSNGIIYVGTEFGISAISTYFIEPNKDFSNLYVYPNPITISSDIDSKIFIDGLIEDSKITILDVSGNLINKFNSIGGKTTIWDCKDTKGKLVASGIYILVAYDEEVKKIGHAKFAVLRK